MHLRREANGKAFFFAYDGAEIAAYPGETVAGALIASGVVTLFCGMGICHDCLVTIDGTPNRRACMERARSGMVVTGREKRA